MSNKSLFTKKVKSIEVRKKSVSQLLKDMSQTGFQGRRLSEVCEVFEKMVRDKNLTILLGYSGSLSVAGQWKLINWLMEQKYIDILVATGANISEDIVEAMGFSYYQETDLLDDNLLFKSGINRYYDVYGKADDYLKMEELISDFIQTLDQDYSYSSMEFLNIFGHWLKAKGIRSIVALAAENKIPVFCPAISDSPYGDAALIAKSKGFNFSIDIIKDYIEFMSLSKLVKETGVIYIGGGVPKDFIQLFAVASSLLYPDRKIPNRKNFLSREKIPETYYPHKYAIQITTDSPQWGGLSGCTFEEAVSWGKETKKGGTVQVYCDATIALPIILHSIAEKKIGKRKGTNFSKYLSKF